MRGWYRVSLMLLLLSVTPPAGARSVCPGGQAHRAYLDGILAMSQQEYAATVSHFERAVQCAPTNTVYANALALAWGKLVERHP
jgi:Flp pilus assembly protein TadD